MRVIRARLQHQRAQSSVGRQLRHSDRHGSAAAARRRQLHLRRDVDEPFGAPGCSLLPARAVQACFCLAVSSVGFAPALRATGCFHMNNHANADVRMHIAGGVTRCCSATNSFPLQNFKIPTLSLSGPAAFSPVRMQVTTTTGHTKIMTCMFIVCLTTYAYLQLLVLARLAAMQFWLA
jgi:hypothetical protein